MNIARPQEFERKNLTIREAFLTERKARPEAFKQPLNLSWSNWGFGIEPLEVSAARLARNGIRFIELHGNHYGPDLGYRPKETLRMLGDHGVTVAGVCGMFSADNDLSSNRGLVRQAAIDYIRRTLDFAFQVKAEYMLVVPGAVGRPARIDDQEFHRSVESLRIVADLFAQTGVKAAVEPIRAAEVSFCHTFDDAEAYIAAVDHPGVRHINGDLFHMLVQEAHVPTRIRQAGDKLLNLHMADTNRCALGDGSLDLADTILMSLYLVGYNSAGRFCTPEPLGPGGDPYPAMFGKPAPELLDALVEKTARTFNLRRQAIMEMQ